MTSGEVVPDPAGMRNPVILLVEDDVLVRFSTAEILRDAGYVVLEAVNASEALALVSSGRPLALVLSDVRMPGEMDGVALSYAVKAQRPDLPIVLASSHLEPDTPLGANVFLAKPYSAHRLIQLVKDVIGFEWQNRPGNPTAS